MTSKMTSHARELMSAYRADYGADLMTLWIRDPDTSTRGKGYVEGFQSLMEAHAVSTLTDGGYDVGSSSVANAADAWRTRAAEMSAAMPSVIPDNWDNRVEVLRDTLTWENSVGEVKSFTLSSDAERVTILISAKPEMLKDYPYLYAKMGSELCDGRVAQRS
eukprot:Blabericola_migrator_1__6941@NODE_3516_length_1714_cov_6_107468_g2183_i0_p3_GENE_NODE_3516_length_1714_cov_6_107468_g2183_i0NODE_3516_length_1714_cov_6_107468_g2183_i0_p3_ORF_typecomplete_len162_score12_58_NODE_3516_length_1714_cov_6_107468_g2183_i05341019